MTDQQSQRRPTEQQREHGDTAGIQHEYKRRRISVPWFARAAAIGLSGVSVIFVLLFLFVLRRGGELILLTRPLPMQLALTLPYLIVIFTLGTVLGTVLGWRNQYWTLSVRIHQTVLALLGLGFSWQLAVLGFLPS